MRLRHIFPARAHVFRDAHASSGRRGKAGRPAVTLLRRIGRAALYPRWGFLGRIICEFVAIEALRRRTSSRGETTRTSPPRASTNCPRKCQYFLRAPTSSSPLRYLIWNEEHGRPRLQIPSVAHARCLQRYIAATCSRMHGARATA